MKRHFVGIGAILLSFLLLARAEGPDDRYVAVYNLIQEADALNDSGQAREATQKYFTAQKALQALQSEFPGWNANVVNFRLGYIATRLEPLAQKYPQTNGAPAIAAVEAPTLTLGTNQLNGLVEEIKRLTAQNALLEAKLKEALSVQPAPLDPRELAKAEEQIKQLQKDKDLLKASLDQEREKNKTVKVEDAAPSEQEKKILADAQQKLSQQTELAATLQKENEALKKQLADLKTAADTATPSADLAQQLQMAKGTIAALQATNLSLRTEQILLESRVTDLSRQVAKRGKSSNPRPSELSRQLDAALARLAVYETKPIPYTPEELAAFKQPDLKASITEVVAPKRSVQELPPGAGPLMQDAQRATESGQFEEAEKKFLEVLRQDDKNIYVLGNLAMVQLEQNHVDEAEKSISRALAVDPRDPACLLGMGLVKYRQSKYDEALTSLSLSASLIPDEPRTQYFLGKTLIQKGNRGAAEAALRKAVQLRPGWGEAHFSLAQVYATQQPPFKELAQWHYQKAIAGGFPRDLEFEKSLEEKKASAAP